MLKVVIVDDEMIVRVGFQSCVRWEEYGCKVTGTCESAEEAIAYFDKDVPDIVFTDIMMPGMDGIQLVQWIRSHHPRVKVVVLSCVNEIDYVKKAIKLGAEDYILKLSFKQETMEELIGKLRCEIEEEKKNERQEDIYSEIHTFNREEGFRMLMSGNLTLQDQESLLDKLGYFYNPFEQYYVGCFLLDHFKVVKGSRNGDLHLIGYSLQNIIREYFDKFPRFDLAFIRENEIMILFRVQEGGIPMRRSAEVIKLLNEALKTHFNMTLSMGMNMKPSSRGEISDHYDYAKSLASLRFFDGAGSYHQDEKIVSESVVTKRSVQKSIQEAIFRQDAVEARRLIEAWFESMKGFQNFEQIGNIRRSVMETWVFVSGYSLPEQTEFPENDELYSTKEFWDAETMEELKELFWNGVQTIIKYLQVNRTANPEILKLLNYLKEHVEENISLENAASRCALGKSQFCILFKKNTGDTFVNYFNKMKMQKAYELLIRENLQVQEVANRIGIRDISYFSRMFKKYYHMSPSDVKNR